MQTFSHHAVASVLVPSLLLASGLAWWRSARVKSRWVKFLAKPLVAASALLLLGNGCVVATTVTEASKPLRSPGGRVAAVVRNWSQGSVGEHGSDVTLYSWGGLREQTIADGQAWAFSEQQVRWVSDAELEIVFNGRDRPFCRSTATVRVLCKPTRQAADIR